MATFSDSILVASAGILTMTPGFPISFTVTWADNISPFRWSRVWPAIQGASDEATFQSVTLLSEGSQWNLEAPASVALAVTMQGDGDLGAPVTARIQVMASQADTF